jgi:hypothetical protein
MWHEDEQYLFDEQSFMTTGMKGKVSYFAEHGSERDERFDGIGAY